MLQHHLFRNSRGVICRPAVNRITIAAISPTCLTVSSSMTSGSPSTRYNPPSANGPTMMPASNSPRTIGSFIRWNNSAISLASKSSIASEIITWMNSNAKRHRTLVDLCSFLYFASKLARLPVTRLG